MHVSDDIGPNEPDGALVPLDRPGGRTQWTFSHAGRSYAVFSVDGELHVTDGACPMYVAGLVALPPGRWKSGIR